jgi:hypothetical protein
VARLLGHTYIQMASRAVESSDGFCTDDWAMRRILLAGLGLAIVAAGCGGSMTASEYVEELNAIASRANALFEPAVASYNQVADPTVADEVVFLSREIEIRREIAVPVDALDPPELLTGVHELIEAMTERQLGAAEGLLPLLQEVNSLDELQGTAELAEYEAANDVGSQVCLDVQATLDALTDKEDPFADTPWISDQLSLAVRGALGCGDVEKA